MKQIILNITKTPATDEVPERISLIANCIITGTDKFVKVVGNNFTDRDLIFIADLETLIENYRKG